MDIDQDYLRTETAIGSLTSNEHWLRFLVIASQSGCDEHARATKIILKNTKTKKQSSKKRPRVAGTPIKDVYIEHV